MTMDRDVQRPLVVFGARGFIGRHTAAALSKNTQFNVCGFTSHDADLRDPEQVGQLAQRMPIGAAWVLAAAITPDRGGPPLDNMMENMRMAANLARLMETAPPARVVQLSSIDVYGRSGIALPINEASPLRPASCFGVSMAASELVIGQACAQAGIPLAILRLPGVYGPGDTHNGPVASFLRAAIDGAPIRVFGNGEQKRDLLFVEDVPRIIDQLLKDRTDGLFNTVTGHSVSLNDMLTIVSECVGRHLEVEYDLGASQYDLQFETPVLLKHFPDLTLTPIENGIRETYTALSNAAKR